MEINRNYEISQEEIIEMGNDHVEINKESVLDALKRKDNDSGIPENLGKLTIRIFPEGHEEQWGYWCCMSLDNPNDITRCKLEDEEIDQIKKIIKEQIEGNKSDKNSLIFEESIGKTPGGQDMYEDDECKKCYVSKGTGFCSHDKE